MSTTNNDHVCGVCGDRFRSADRRIDHITDEHQDALDRLVAGFPAADPGDD